MQVQDIAAQLRDGRGALSPRDVASLLPKTASEVRAQLIELGHKPSYTHDGEEYFEAAACREYISQSLTGASPVAA